ncbi:MAG: DUF5711 family protein [Clostridiales bacterium]|nr:DUF5711 family protein [Clostridiales bacterium]
MDSEEKSSYYSKREKVFRILKYVTLIVLILFTVIASIAGRSHLSISSFDSFINYIRINPKLSESEYVGVYYSSSQDSKFAIFDNQLVVFSNGVLNFYSLGGIKLASFDNGCDEMNANGKYYCCYNTNSGNILLYNYYSEAYSFTTDNTLSKVVTGKLGGFATISASGSEMYAEVYSKEFKSVMKTEKTSGTIYDCALDENEKMIAVLIQDQQDSFRTANVVVNRISDEKELLREKYTGEISVSVGFVADRLYCITDKCIRFFDSSFKETEKLSFEGNLLRIFKGENGVVVSTYKDGVTTSKLLTKEGKSKLTVNCEGKALKCVFDESRMFLLSSSGIYSASDDGQIEKTEVYGVRDLFLLGSSDVMLCFDDRTDLLSNVKEVKS